MVLHFFIFWWDNIGEVLIAVTDEKLSYNLRGFIRLYRIEDL